MPKSGLNNSRSYSAWLPTHRSVPAGENLCEEHMPCATAGAATSRRRPVSAPCALRRRHELEPRLLCCCCLLLVACCCGGASCCHAPSSASAAACVSIDVAVASFDEAWA